MSQGHSGPVTSLAVLEEPDGGLLLASTAGDGTVNVWRRACAGACSVIEEEEEALWGQEAWSLAQSIAWGVQLQHSLALTQMPGHPGWSAILPLQQLVASSSVPLHMHLHVEVLRPFRGCSLRTLLCLEQAAAGAGRRRRQHLAAAAPAGRRLCARVPPARPR